MRLENHISDLLYRYECVTVPGLGAFLSQRIPARIDTDSHTFFPPTKRVSFNAQLKDNDGLLTRHVAQAESISYEKATKEVQNQAFAILKSLKDSGSFEFPEVGTLLQNAAGSVTFEPSTITNYLTDSFGLSSISVHPVAREVYKEQVRALEKKAPLPLTPGRRNTPVWLKYAAIGLLAIGITGGGLGYMHVEKVKIHNLAEKKKAQAALESQIQQATFVIDNPLPPIILNVHRPLGDYHLIAGAFRMEENAQSKVEELRDKGYSAREIGANRFGLYQVVYASYQNRKEALEALLDVRRTDNDGAWMLVQDLDAAKAE